MKTLRLTVLVPAAILGTLLLLAESVPQPDDPGVLLRAAIEKEEVDGDLNAAIEMYKRIVAGAGNNHAVAAKALLRMGQCYEKLGNAEARRAYQQLIDNYPGQKQEVAAARERIALLVKAASEQARKPTFRKAEIAVKLNHAAQLSPDGKKLAFVSKGSIWLLPVQGPVSPDLPGAPDRLNVDLPEGLQIDWAGLTWSADGKWIAFNDLPVESVVSKTGPWTQGIHVVRSTGGKPAKLPVASERGDLVIFYYLSLSPDGRRLAFSPIEDDEPHIKTISVEGGAARRLTEPPTLMPAFSPNGMLIAHVRGSYPKGAVDKDRFEKRTANVWVIPAEGGTPTLVADVPGVAQSPIWSPDGRMIAFLGGQAIWVAPVSSDGKPQAAPTKFDLPASVVDRIAGWTPDNKIALLMMSPVYRAVFTVPVAGGVAAQVTPQSSVMNPQWSPDGKRIYLQQGNNISFVPVGGGKVSPVPVGSGAKFRTTSMGSGNAVSPDGKRIVFAGMKDRVPGVHLWIVPVEGGEPAQLTQSPADSEDRWPCWSGDGRWIAFVRARREKHMQVYVNPAIYKVPSEGGDVIPLTSEAEKVAFNAIAWSPDMKSIAYFSDDIPTEVKLKSLETGMTRVLAKAEDRGWHSLSWSPDGKKLAFDSAPYTRKSGTIKIISLDDGSVEAVETRLADAMHYQVSWSPDGTKLAFGAVQGGEPELWFMEDFLRLVKTGK